MPAAHAYAPGHKANGRRFPLFRDAALDITELPFSDCLESPDGAIARAQEDVADALGAAKSYFLTDGSSCGVYAMLYVAKRRGGKVIIARNSHKSVYNACAVLGIEPVILKNNEKDGILLRRGRRISNPRSKKRRTYVPFCSHLPIITGTSPTMRPCARCATATENFCSWTARTGRICASIRTARACMRASTRTSG